MTKSNHIPGTWVLLTSVAALLGATIWMALNRTVPLDGLQLPGENPRAASLPDMRVDLNAAGAAELGLLPAIGPELAQRIVTNRESHGPFKDIDDLSRVSGIGPATIDRLRAYVVVGEGKW